jgi:ABC-2 type transport system ATP-binding protein
MDRSTDGGSVVVLRGVSKTYRRFQALDHVSFSLAPGEVFGYIGPNGAGKTTTMKILTGLITDFSGDVEIGGRRVPERIGETHRLLGYLPQNAAFQEWRTVDHALQTFGRLSGLTKAETAGRVPEVLEMLSLSDVRRKKISQLSGGMAQKVGLAQALLHSPKVLVLDEPFNGLDPLSRHQFKEIVRTLAKNGTTVLFSSHILSDVQDLADRVGILSRGRLMQVGSIEELTARLSPGQAIEVLLLFPTDKWQRFGSLANVAHVEETTPGRILVHVPANVDPFPVVDGLIRMIADLSIRVRGVMLLPFSLDEIYSRYVHESEWPA